MCLGDDGWAFEVFGGVVRRLDAVFVFVGTGDSGFNLGLPLFLTGTLSLSLRDKWSADLDNCWTFDFGWGDGEGERRGGVMIFLGAGDERLLGGLWSREGVGDGLLLCGEDDLDLSDNFGNGSGFFLGLLGFLLFSSPPFFEIKLKCQIRENKERLITILTTNYQCW